MYPRATLRQVKKFQRDECRRTVMRIENLIAELEQMNTALIREITVEQDRFRIHDPTNVAYPLFARAANQRRENVQRSIEELRKKLSDAQGALGEALDELGKVESLDERRQLHGQQGKVNNCHLDDWRIKSSRA
jgi:hypothetical protein